MVIITNRFDMVILHLEYLSSFRSFTIFKRKIEKANLLKNEDAKPQIYGKDFLYYDDWNCSWKLEI